jgi:hypothetical protein
MDALRRGTSNPPMAGCVRLPIRWFSHTRLTLIDFARFDRRVSAENLNALSWPCNRASSGLVLIAPRLLDQQIGGTWVGGDPAGDVIESVLLTIDCWFSIRSLPQRPQPQSVRDDGDRAHAHSSAGNHRTKM